jgi:hypothetical protein
MSRIQQIAFPQPNPSVVTGVSKEQRCAHTGFLKRPASLPGLMHPHFYKNLRHDTSTLCGRGNSRIALTFSRRGTLVVPGEKEWMIQHRATDLTSRSLRQRRGNSRIALTVKSQRHACRAHRKASLLCRWETDVTIGPSGPNIAPSQPPVDARSLSAEEKWKRVSTMAG